MQPLSLSMLEHIRWLRYAADAVGGEFLVAGDSLVALVRRGRAQVALKPRFLTTVDGETLYTPGIQAHSEGFAGWLPYVVKRWPLAADRLLFKAHARAGGLPVLESFVDPVQAPASVVIRRAVASSQRALRGPFRSGRDHALSAGQNEFYEPFVEGDRLTVWFWNATPVCAELERMPVVTGDGSSTVGDRIVERAGYTGPSSEPEAAGLLSRCEALLKFHGATLDTVLPPGVRALVDFRHGSCLAHPSDRTLVDLLAPTVPAWAAILQKAGAHLRDGIPEEIRADTLFTVDAILEPDGKLWLLEMSGMSVVHPLVYPAMLDSLLREPAARAAFDARRPAPPSGPAPEAT